MSTQIALFHPVKIMREKQAFKTMEE